MSCLHLPANSALPSAELRLRQMLQNHAGECHRTYFHITFVFLPPLCPTGLTRLWFRLQSLCCKHCLVASVPAACSISNNSYYRLIHNWKLKLKLKPKHTASLCPRCAGKTSGTHTHIWRSYPLSLSTFINQCLKGTKMRSLFFQHFSIVIKKRGCLVAECFIHEIIWCQRLLVACLCWFAWSQTCWGRPLTEPSPLMTGSKIRKLIRSDGIDPSFASALKKRNSHDCDSDSN